jgi:tRNA-dihydrouridine synthase 3
LIYFVIQEVIKSKPDAANDDKKVNHDNLDGNDDENKEPLCNPPVNAECDSTLCEELDRSEGEPLIDNSIPCVEPRPTKKSKVESDEIDKHGAGLFLNFKIAIFNASITLILNCCVDLFWNIMV